jgi:hypothetical protein
LARLTDRATWYGAGILALTQVMFCSRYQLEFRKPTPEDMFGSNFRKQVFNRFLDFELLLSRPDSFEVELLRDSRNTLNELQKDVALEHWHVMRTVLAEEVWINY